MFCFQALEPDPILKLKRIVGFGGASFRDVSFVMLVSWSIFFSACISYHSAVVKFEMDLPNLWMFWNTHQQSLCVKLFVQFISDLKKLAGFVLFNFPIFYQMYCLLILNPLQETRVTLPQHMQEQHYSALPHLIVCNVLCFPIIMWSGILSIFFPGQLLLGTFLKLLCCVARRCGVAIGQVWCIPAMLWWLSCVSAMGISASS